MKGEDVFGAADATSSSGLVVLRLPKKPVRTVPTSGDCKL